MYFVFSVLLRQLFANRHAKHRHVSHGRWYKNRLCFVYRMRTHVYLMLYIYTTYA